MGQDDQRPAWVGLVAVLAVVVGIVVVSIVGSNLPHSDSTTTTAARSAAEETACAVQLLADSFEVSDHTEIVVQLRLLEQEQCFVQGELTFDFGETPEPILGNPAVNEIGMTLSPKSPYMVVTYVWQNWCEGPLSARIQLGEERTSGTFDAPCLDSTQRSTIAPTHVGEPMSTSILP